MLIPDHETEVDFLNCDAISRTVVELLKDNRSRALTIGIHGDWGAGKSSVLKMVETELKSDKNVACLWFNGWAFEGFEDAKTVLIKVTIAELFRQRSAVGKMKELSTRLLKRVDLLKLIKVGSGIAFSLLPAMAAQGQITSATDILSFVAANVSQLKPDDIQTRLEEAVSILKPAKEANIPEVIHSFRDDFHALLDEAKIDQLVVLIDDLDRCLPETAIGTLEAIRLFLFVPKTAFIIGADEAMIEYAVRKHFPDLPIASGPLPYARNYLEKLVQVPLRIPTLGAQETRTYVTLILVESIVGDNHQGFQALLKKAKDVLSKPWLASSLSQQDIQVVDPAKHDALNAAFVLAQQIGPILAEGTKGNPRQIKRFLNALLVRQTIAKARGFSDLIHQAVLAKLMLAERFQPDFYDALAEQAMISEDGKATELAELEVAVREMPANSNGKSSKKKKLPEAEPPHSPEVAKWLERDWLKRWLKIEPDISGIDLRPYVFVARDKRLLTGDVEVLGLEGLITRLCGSQLSVRSAEAEVKALVDVDAGIVFGQLRERILRATNFTTPPPGIDGMAIVAKHHTRFQSEVVSLLGSLNPKDIGFWIVRGWNESITDRKAREQLITVIDGWAKQDDNTPLKKAAQAAIAMFRKETK